jgi:ribosomal protein S18 acetylase RimI-like enzyme
MYPKEIILDNAPTIAGLNYRGFAGESDYPHMLNIIDKASQADKEKRATTLADIQHDYAHLTNSDPEKDLIFAEINDEAVAYSRVEWQQEEDPNDRIYSHFVHILPKWRNQGIEESLIQWCESRLKTIAKEHPRDSQRFFQTFSSALKPAYNQILESQGYEATRFFIEMSRPLDNIPDADLPEGIEVRPARDENISKIWEASVEAFRDHWGFAEPKEEEFISYKGSKYFQPDLWQVAWDGDEVVSSVMNYIDYDYNEKYQLKRGWTENISTRREWRRRGIAKALIVRSMHMHKAKGMTEVALGVDTNNPNGALRLYQSLGYEKDITHITYRKTM